MNSQNHLRNIIAKHCKRGQFTLSSGKSSDFYIDMRAVIGLGSIPLEEFGAEISQFMQALNANVVAGPASAAIPLMTSALLSYDGPVINFGTLDRPDYRGLKMVYTRSQSKDHGLRQNVEGPALEIGDRIILVDDVLTTGGSLLKCAAALEFPGIEIVGAWTCVDREEGGRESLMEHLPQLKVTSMFYKTELLEAIEAAGTTEVAER